MDFDARQLHVCEQVLESSTKTGETGVVDIAAPLADLLRGVLARRREDSMAAGLGGQVSPYVVFPWLSDRPDTRQEQKAVKRVRRAMARILKLAALPSYFTPHSLRHSFCSLLIAAGVSPVYVQQQAGHANVAMTVGVYGSWFALKAPGALDRLAAGALGGSLVTNQGQSGNNPDTVSPQPPTPTGTYGAGTISRPSPA